MTSAVGERRARRLVRIGPVRQIDRLVGRGRRSLRQLIETGRVTEARRLTVEAARRFLDHPRVRLAKRVLNDGKATLNPWVQPTATAEIAWLDDPPDEARGKWVALIGGELIGIADSARKLVESLALKDLRQLPVVQYIAP